MDHNPATNRLEAVNLRLLKLGVREQDIVEQFIHSGGKGGQNVNKVSTAVRITLRQPLNSAEGHTYAGEDVKCMRERSQYLNRIAAREILADRLEKKRSDALQFAKAEEQKARRLKAGRPKSIKRRILKDKRIKSIVKKNRTWRQGRDE
jgi:protein subunit release factor B